jgi:16S rRNA processing protein RimM
MRMHKDYGLLKLADVPDRSQAEFLRGLFVMIALDQAIPLEDDEVYLFQLIGMRVQTEDNTLLGEITDVIETGANDVYIIHSPDYGEVLIPITEETLLDTDPEAGMVTVRLPDGLLPSS